MVRSQLGFMSQKISPKRYIYIYTVQRYKMVNSRLCETARLRDCETHVSKFEAETTKKSRIRDAKSQQNETSRLTMHKNSRSDQNFSRPTFFEEPFYTPSISNDTSKKKLLKTCQANMSLQKAQLQYVSIFFTEFVHPGVPPIEYYKLPLPCYE